jgi:hypothetical protein
MTASLVEHAHRQAVTASLKEVASRLQELLTRRLTAYIAGVDSVKTITRWTTGETTEIRDVTMEQRLRTAYEIALLLLEQDSPETVRAWFIGLNPQLDDQSPAEAIHNDQLKEVRSAARAFASGG